MRLKNPCNNLLLIFLASIFSFCSFYMLVPVLPLYFNEIGKDQRIVGLLMGIVAVTLIISRPLVGFLNDTNGSKANLFFGIIVYSIVPLFYLKASNTAYLLLIRLLHGFGSAFLYKCHYLHFEPSISREIRKNYRLAMGLARAIFRIIYL